MEEGHKKAIQNNFVSLMDTTDLDSMVTALYQRRVFSEQMIEPYKDITVTQSERKRKLYLDIMRRGPQAFGNLLEVLKELGYWDLVRDLDPNSPLHLRPRRTTNAPIRPLNVPNANGFISISQERQKTKSEGEAPRNVAANAMLAPVTAPNNNENDQPFVVKKSTRFIEDNESKDIKPYRTRGKNRGVVLLFTYVSFEHNIEPYRNGVDVDCKNLKYLFKELGFSVLAYMNLTLEETERTLLMLKEVLVDCESVFVVISSHGYERARSSDTDVRCSDGGLLSLRDIISYFSNQRLPLLAHVPKVFIFQTCRGENSEYVWCGEGDGGGGGGAGAGQRARPAQLRMPETDGTAQAPGSDPPPTPPHVRELKKKSLYSNILIAQSTLPGFVSHRDPKLGSWYVQALCEVFAARAHDTHVDELFTLVDKRLVERFEIQTSSVDRWGFNQRLYLHPGLHESS